MASGLFGAARELPRLREISSVLIRHGLGDIVRRAGVSTLLERAGQILHWGQAGDIAHLEPQQRARLALEELGPTFVKLGQMLSTREDLLPPSWTDELGRCTAKSRPCRSTISCRRWKGRWVIHPLKFFAISSVNPTRLPLSRRYTGPRSRTARRLS